MLSVSCLTRPSVDLSGSRVEVLDGGRIVHRKILILNPKDSLVSFTTDRMILLFPHNEKVHSDHSQSSIKMTKKKNTIKVNLTIFRCLRASVNVSCYSLKNSFGLSFSRPRNWGTGCQVEMINGL